MIMPLRRSPISPRPGRHARLLLILPALLLVPVGLLSAARAGVQFENCSSSADGSISCDTVPTGNTVLDAMAARDGLFQNASPGWNEFEPFQGYDQEFGDTED